MDLQPTYQKEKLFQIFCSPGEMICCGSLPLRSGIYIVVVLDILVGMLHAAELFTLINSQNRGLWQVQIVQELEIIVGLSAIPFAVIGLMGIRTVQQPKVHIYSIYKQVEIPTLLCLMLAQNIVTCEDLYDNCNPVVIILGVFLRTIFNLYFTHVVWSADLRLQHNETVLVLHGKEVLMLMREQARALAPSTYVVAEPGQAVSVTPVGSPQLAADLRTYSNY